MLLINVFSQKMETSFRSCGGVNPLHKLALPTARVGAGACRDRQSRGKKGTRHFITLVSPSEEKLDLGWVQIAPTRPSVPLRALPAWHPAALWGWRASVAAPGETPRVT